MGGFGSGKTLSVVKKTHDILNKYPKCTFITNTTICGIGNETHFFENAEELCDILKKVIDPDNENGYIILIDEIHVVLQALIQNSDPIFLTYLSQLRKLGIFMIGTTQLYNKCPKLVRDYIRLSGQIIFCNKILGGITINQFVDMETCSETANLKLNYNIKHWESFFHTIELYECYDTHAIVSQVKELINYKRKETKESGLSTYN